MNIPEKIKHLMALIETSGFEAYVIGGAVRDYYLGFEPHDYDIFTNASGEEILKIFPTGKVLGGDERQEKILTVIVDDVEISSYRKSGDRKTVGKTLEDHQWTCDFYINALAVNMHGELCGDLTIKRCGLNDITNRVLRFVGSPQDRINEDPLRILRGIRFWNDFGCFKDLNCVMDNLHKLDDIPKERLRDEFLKIIATTNGLENLWCDGIIYKIIPMLKTIMNIQGGNHHKEKVDKHLTYSFNYAKQITNNRLIWLAALLHDIGKGVTFMKEGEEIHFYEHEKKGAEMVEEWMTEYKFSKEDIKVVTTLISLHMYSYKSEPNKKSYMKFFAKLEAANIDIMDYIMLLYCDHQGNQKKKRIKFGDFVKGNWLLAKYWECKYTKEPFTVKDLIIGGKDLIERYNMKPSPEIGKILNKIHDKILEGELRNERGEIFHYLNNEEFKLEKVKQ